MTWMIAADGKNSIIYVNSNCVFFFTRIDEAVSKMHQNIFPKLQGFDLSVNSNVFQKFTKLFNVIEPKIGFVSKAIDWDDIEASQ